MKGDASLMRQSYLKLQHHRGSSDYFKPTNKPRASQFMTSTKSTAHQSAADRLLGPDKRLHGLERVDITSSESMNAIQHLKEAKTMLYRENGDLRLEVG